MDRLQILLVIALLGTSIASSADDAPYLEEIVVTAQKREENLQDVPISVQAFPAASLEMRGLDDPKGLAELTPGMSYNEQAGFTFVFLRGIGSDIFLATADQSVATYIDGVYQPFPQAIAQSFFPLDHIEVLKGPQGTLYGRNATGGAINVITRKPSGEGELAADTELGSHGTRNVRFYFSTPSVQSLSAAAAAIYTHGDPYAEPTARSPVRHLSSDVTKGVNARILWEPIEELRATVRGFSIESDGTSSAAFTNQDTKPLGALLGVRDLDPYEVEINTQPSVVSKNTQGSAELVWAPEWFDLKVLGSHQHVKVAYSFDYDSSATDIVAVHTPNTFERVTTAELQLLSKAGGLFPDWLTWTSGFYFFRASGGYDPFTTNVASFATENPAVPGLPAPLTLIVHGTLLTTAYAGYVQATVSPLSWLDLTFGGRYQHETRRLTEATSRFGVLGGAPTDLNRFPLESTVTDDFSPKVTLSLMPSDDQLVYASWQKGFKSGTYNVVTVTLPPSYVKPEFVTAYEIGNKGTFFDGALRYGVAAFHTAIEDLQTLSTTSQSGGIQNLFNAGEATIYGAELDLLWHVLPESVPGLVLSTSAAYLHGRYDEFRNGPGYDEETGLYFGPGATTGAPGRDFSGNETVRTPETTVVVGPSYSMDAFGGTIDLGVDVYWNSGFWFDAQNVTKQSAYTTVGARGGYLYEPWNLRVAAFGRNVADEVYYLNRLPGDFGTVSVFGPPAQWGVRLSWEF